MTTVLTERLVASQNPIEDIAMITPLGQALQMRMYRPGYENFMNAIPVLNVEDELFQQKVDYARNVMHVLARGLMKEKWVKDDMPEAGGFSRTILALESPTVNYDGNTPHIKENAEIIVAKWGRDFTSPVHGHANGFMQEEVVDGIIRANTYRMVDIEKRVARPLRTEIFKSGVTIVAQYNKKIKGNPERSTLIHSFTALVPSATLHFIPEHTRDSRDNKFTVEYFENHVDIANAVRRIDTNEAYYSRKGDVILVRSRNVPEYGDHFIVITGAPIMKEHGLRPQETAIYTGLSKSLLDKYDDGRGLTLLKLDAEATKLFHAFHGIEMRDGEVIFPE